MPKSILKQSSTSRDLQLSSSREAHNREIALFHANLIQEQKDIESFILSATETLLDFPPSQESNPAHPAPVDTATAKVLLVSFQVSDFDALIEERNIGNKCGYILCPKPNRQEDTKAHYRILQSKGEGKKDLMFVDRRVLERWCSDDCGKRAMFIRVQLSEEPAWVRTSGTGGDIMFLEDEDDSGNGVIGALVKQLQVLDVGSDVDGRAAALDQLAIERGDEHGHSNRSVIVDVNIHEKTVLQDPILVQENKESGELQDSIEGYISRFHGSTR